MTRARLALFVHRGRSAARPQVRVVLGGWCADRVDRDLAAGPSAALALLDELEPVGVAGWPPEDRLDGGVAIDTVERRLVFFGGDRAIRFDPRVRAVRLELLRRVWAGWDVRYALGGILELAAVAGMPRDAVLDPEGDRPCEVPSPPWWTGPVDCLLTIGGADGAGSVHPLSWHPIDVGLSGPAIVDELAATPDSAVAGPIALARPPLGGVTVDRAARTVEVWLAEPWADAASRLARRWPDYSVRFRGDDFAPQLAATGGRVEIDAVDRHATTRAFVARVVGVDGAQLDRLFDEVRERIAADRPVAVDTCTPSHQLSALERAWIVGVALGI